jgi:hypothetical protein
VAQYLLDENLSHRVARALILCEYAVTHVALEDDLGVGTADEVIVPWCGDTGHIWVTADHDPRGRHIRFSLLPQHKVHAIILDPEPSGLRGQLLRIVARIDEWERHFNSQPYDGYGVWKQRERGALRKA